MRSWNVRLEDIANMENARRCRTKAGQGKRDRKSVFRFDDDKRLGYLVMKVASGVYEPLPPMEFDHHDKGSGKVRHICCPAFRDQIVHWMIVQALQPHLMQHFIKHTVASIPGRGLEYGRNVLRSWAQCRSSAKWILKTDVRKFYESVDVQILIGMLSRHIRDERVVDLIRRSLTIPGRAGLTLGSYLSQWMANFYLSDFDHWVKEELQVSCYLRYMDDMTLGFSSRRKARKALELMTARLAEIGLEVKTQGSGSASIFRWRDQFIDMLGYRSYSDGFQELRRRNYLADRRLVDRIEKNGCSRFQALSLLSRRGFVVHSDCVRFLERIDTLIQSKRIKEIAHERIAI